MLETEYPDSINIIMGTGIGVSRLNLTKEQFVNIDELEIEQFKDQVISSWKPQVDEELTVIAAVKGVQALKRQGVLSQDMALDHLEMIGQYQANVDIDGLIQYLNEQGMPDVASDCLCVKPNPVEVYLWKQVWPFARKLMPPLA